jgi:hypothetical protein
MFPRLFSPSATSRPDDKEPPISPEEYERVFLELTTNNSLEQLLKQPAILEEQRRQIRQEMESLAFNNYPIFLQTASCVTEVHSQVSLSRALIFTVQPFIDSLFDIDAFSSRQA